MIPYSGPLLKRKVTAMSPPPPEDSVQKSKEPFPSSHYIDCNAVFRNRVVVVVGYQQQVFAPCLLRDGNQRINLALPRLYAVYGVCDLDKYCSISSPLLA